MKEKNAEETQTDAHRRQAPQVEAGEPAGRTLFSMRAGGRLLAVFAGEVEAVAENLRPTPLPHAPPPVLGVVYMRGRMRTVINPLPLLADEEAADETGLGASETRSADDETHFIDDASDATEDGAGGTSDDRAASAIFSPRIFVALGGDEQLALAVESLEASTDLPNLPHAPAPETDRLIRANVPRGDSFITLLNPARLFEAAMRGTERRRPRV